MSTMNATNSMIGYLGLSDWWFASFTELERSAIQRTYNPLSSYGLVNGKIEYSDVTRLSFLTNLAGWFAKDEVRSIAYRILDKAATYVPTARDPLDVHFFYQTQIEIYYRDRNTQEGLNGSINACQRQIAYAATAASAFKRQYPTQPLPSHKGYTQLAIIFERQKKYPEAINLCSAAKNDGWYGDWGGRIARCNKKLESA
jgi:hypothetical protein